MQVFENALQTRFFKNGDLSFSCGCGFFSNTEKNLRFRVTRVTLNKLRAKKEIIWMNSLTYMAEEMNSLTYMAEERSMIQISGLCTSQIEASTSPPWAYLRYLTPFPAWEGGNLITTHRGWGI